MLESFLELTFTCPYITNIIPNYNQQDATILDLFISTDFLNVSGGSSAHHQEQNPYIQLQVLPKPILLLAAIVVDNT